MANQKKLSPEEEKTVAIARLCGIPSLRLEEEFGVCRTTLQHHITYVRAPTWNDPLVDFYLRQGRSLENSAHLFLGTIGEKVPKKEFVNESARPAYEMIMKHIYGPLREQIKLRSAIERYYQPKNPFEVLLHDVFKDYAPTSKELVESSLIRSTWTQYFSPSFALQRIEDSATESIEDLVRSGVFFMNNGKEKVLLKALEGLTCGQKDVLTLNYLKRVNNLAEVGRLIGTSRANTCELAHAGLKALSENQKLRNCFIEPLNNYLQA